MFCSSAHLYDWLREHRYMLCNRQPTAVEEGMQPLLPSRHMGGRLGLCDGHHLGGHEVEGGVARVGRRWIAS